MITAIDTLVHVPDFDETVKSIHRALKPGGWLLTCPDRRPRMTRVGVSRPPRRCWDRRAGARATGAL